VVGFSSMACVVEAGGRYHKCRMRNAWWALPHTGVNLCPVLLSTFAPYWHQLLTNLVSGIRGPGYQPAGADKCAPAWLQIAQETLSRLQDELEQLRGRERAYAMELHLKEDMVHLLSSEKANLDAELGGIRVAADRQHTELQSTKLQVGCAASAPCGLLHSWLPRPHLASSEL
jgi:hypothetical protein